MPNGIIISTQSPIEGNTWPRPGGTAFALAKATEFPVIKMHRNGLPREDEKTILGGLTNGGIVFITGHGSSGGNAFSGLYQSNESSESSVIQNWQLSAYCNLIMNNSSLKEGDSLTLVLWACKAGAGQAESTAAKLLELFLDKGISTRIIASTENLQRFDGTFIADEEDGRKIKFRTKPGSINIFDSILADEKKGFKTRVHNGSLFFSLAGIHLNNAHFEMVCKDSLYRKEIDSPEDASAFLEANQERVIFHRSQVSVPGKEHFAMTYRQSDGTTQTEFFYLDETNKLTSCDQSGSMLYECNIGSSCISLLLTLSQRKPAQLLHHEHVHSSYYKEISGDELSEWFDKNPEENFMIRFSSMPVSDAVATLTFSMRGAPYRYRYIIHPLGGLQKIYSAGEKGSFIPVPPTLDDIDLGLFLKSVLIPIPQRPKEIQIAPVSSPHAFFTHSSSSSSSSPSTMIRESSSPSIKPKSSNMLCAEYKLSPFYHDQITAENAKDWFAENPGKQFVMHPSTLSRSTSLVIMTNDAYGSFSISQLDSQNQVCSHLYMIAFGGGLQRILADDTLDQFIPVPADQEIGQFLKDCVIPTLQTTLLQVSQPPASSAASSSSMGI